MSLKMGPECKVFNADIAMVRPSVGIAMASATIRVSLVHGFDRICEAMYVYSAPRFANLLEQKSHPISPLSRAELCTFPPVEESIISLINLG